MQANSSLVVAAILALSLIDAAKADPGGQREVSEVVRDLEAFVPKELERSGVPGLSIALLRDGKTVWSAGFGFADTLTRRPVSAATVFQVASNGKAVAGYASVILAQQGRWKLDDPLGEYVSVPFLPDASRRDEVTVRRVLTHTAGLSNRVDQDDRRFRFVPGERFAYGGMGYSYLTAAIDALHPGGFEEAIQDLVLKPLDMTSSGYVYSDVFSSDYAYAHIPMWNVLLFFAAPAAIAWVVLTGMFFLADRYWLKRPWNRWKCCGTACLAVLISTGILLVVVGWAAAFYSSAIFGSAFLALVLLLTLAWGRGWAFASMVVLAAALLSFSVGCPFPLPRSSLPEPNAAYSLYSTAPDLARFLEELAAPALLTTEAASRYADGRVEVKEGIAWGLGIGVARTPVGTALWHWGQNLGYESLIVLYPESGAGVVILTNGTGGLEIADRVVLRALGGPSTRSWRRIRIAW